ncbi:MAG TPA: hypothetical protein VHZ05_06695 [Acidimicrobiales bacterium]|nr:hypothetical protein [Acidimicrobiales bacterium]
MVVWHWVQQHRVLSVLILAFVIVSSAGGTAWALVFRTVSSPVGLRAALRTYRREQTEKVVQTLLNRLPSPGVYSYRTTGGESLSLPGMDRSFPRSTSMIVTGGSCATVSWVPLTQHTETTTECAGSDGGFTVPRLVTHESIAGSDTTSTEACPATAYLLPPKAAAGQRWTATCSLQSPAEKVALAGEALGQSTMSVAGHAVRVEHTRITLSFGGSEAGTNPTDFWIVPSSGLIVQEKEAVAATSGGIHYSETMLSTLTSLSPLR